MSFLKDASKLPDPPLGVTGTISPASSQCNPMDFHTRRPALLPAFEPVSSSPPALSRKRRFEDDLSSRNPAYPTPVPTSSTGILVSSSPPHRPGINRTASTLSERAPLSDVPTVVIPENGDRLYLGRSSNSCLYQFPYNRLISRRHVSVTYESPDIKHASGKILIECLGWNGCVIRCKTRVEELGKDDVFVVADPNVEIMLEVMDKRVILAWPEVDVSRIPSFRSESPWDASPSRRPANVAEAIASSPPVHPRSPPVSPSPSRRLSTILFPQPAPVTIYEDPTSERSTNEPTNTNDENVVPASTLKSSTSTFNSADLSDNENEENEPIVHSFGPFGSNILSRLNSFSAKSPELKRKQSSASESRSPLARASQSPRKKPPTPQTRKAYNGSPIKNHVINQLAFSRVHAIPVSTILKNLPADLKHAPASPSSSTQPPPLSADDLRDMLHAIPCVGEISRSGKDAAGKPLENEFYYVPDRDDNFMRRDAVVSGMGSTGLRSVRKNHKQYFWKRPRH